MRKLQNQWYNFLNDALEKLSCNVAHEYAILTPSSIPDIPGVYVISVGKNETEEPYYIGRTKNLRQRLYNNHLMGPLTNARLKKYLVNSGECKNKDEAKNFIRKNCHVRWMIENDVKKRGAVEGYVTGMLFPKYGIYEEH